MEKVMESHGTSKAEKSTNLIGRVTFSAIFIGPVHVNGKC